MVLYLQHVRYNTDDSLGYENNMLIYAGILSDRKLYCFISETKFDIKVANSSSTSDKRYVVKRSIRHKNILFRVLKIQ